MEGDDDANENQRYNNRHVVLQQTSHVMCDV